MIGAIFQGAKNRLHRLAGGYALCEYSAIAEGWAKLARNLKAEIDEALIEAYRSTVSLPFMAGEHRPIAVKIVDDRGIESLKVLELPE